MRVALYFFGSSSIRYSALLLAGIVFFFSPGSVIGQNAKSSLGSRKRVVSKARTSAKTSPSRHFEIEISAPAPTIPRSMDTNLQMLPQTPPSYKERNGPLELERERPIITEKKALPGAVEFANIPAVQPPVSLIPTPSASFDGLDFSSWGAGWPPDTVGDVGPNHYVQAVNTSMGVYDKTGARQAAFKLSEMWAGAGTGTICDTSHSGDPTVIYDVQYNRFIVADFAFASSTAPPFYECIAVSKTSDPVSGGWWMYAVRTDDATHPWLADYPKMGIWSDGLYMTANMFNSSSKFQEVRVWAFSLSDLVSGAPLTSRVVDLNTTSYFSILPANYRGPLPPAGRDEFLISESETLFAFEVFKFHVDFTGVGTTFSATPTYVSQSAYTTPDNTVPSLGNSLDALEERLMMQAQYRNIGGVESLWVNHTVKTGNGSAPNGIQWAQIDVTGGTVATSPVQQQIYGDVSNDGIDRWMGSIAVDQVGNVALGYSRSSNTTNPSIAYSGRLAGDTLGTLAQGETVIQAGGGSQTGNCGGGPCARWGDYSSMSVDPTDGCTFWYTTQYFATNGLNWQTRIAAFRFPSCVGTTAAHVLVQGRVATSGGSPVQNVFVTLRDQNGVSWTARTNTFGYYNFESIPVGTTYILTASNRKLRFENNPRALNVVDMVLGADFVVAEQ
jgi:hypothetical protein